jgi:hypothetical protein
VIKEGRVWRDKLLLFDHLPIYALEEGVVLDDLDVSVVGAESLGGVLLEQLSEEVFGIVGDVLGIFDMFVIQDSVDDVVSIGFKEGRQTGQHLIQHAPEAPPVARLPIVVLLNDLGRNVLDGAAEAVGLGGADQVVLGEAEVSQHCVTRLVDQDVFWLQTTQ